MTPLSIYVHWPFCKSKCPYCDFNSHVRDSVDHARWRGALLAELEYYKDRLAGREIASIFFGGGTPSLMEPETVRTVIDAAAKHWAFAPDVEITLEANPTSVEAGKLKGFRQAGVNRVSLGVQSLVAADLAFLGRQHDVDEAMAAVTLAREIFPRMSFDLIYARPGQTLAQWKDELTRAIGYAADHLSLYQLTIEENTAFHHAHKNGKFVMPEDGPAADMYQLTQEITEAHGLPAYEISNHAKPGAESRHNLAYWRGDDYIGIGPGAHGRYSLNAPCGGLLPAAMEQSSRLARPAGREQLIRCWLATDTLKSPERWLENVESRGNGLVNETALTSREREEEILMMGLRLRDGIDYADWQRRTGFALAGNEDARAHLLTSVSMYLYNRWKSEAQGNLKALVQFLREHADSRQLLRISEIKDPRAFAEALAADRVLGPLFRERFSHEGKKLLNIRGLRDKSDGYLRHQLTAEINLALTDERLSDLIDDTLLSTRVKTMLAERRSDVAVNRQILDDRYSSHLGGQEVVVPSAQPRDVTVLDVLVDDALREDFVTECENLLLFDSVYDQIIEHLDTIAEEAESTRALSKRTITKLLDTTLAQAARAAVNGNAGTASGEAVVERLRGQFFRWFLRVADTPRSTDFFRAVEEWKKTSFPHLSDTLFVVVTFLFERLLGMHLQSEKDRRRYDGRISPRAIGRRKDFWNRLTIAYRDLRIQEVVEEYKGRKATGYRALIDTFFTDFEELYSDLLSSDPCEFPGFRISIESALKAKIPPCGIVTGIGTFNDGAGGFRVGAVISNIDFQAGAFDMASAEKFCKLLVDCAERQLPVIGFISSGGMQTKEGAGALFSMAAVNDRITRFVRDSELPVIMFGFGDCTGGAQASFVTHPLAQTYYFSGTNMPFAGQIVVQSNLPSTSTLSNYLSVVPGAMQGLVRHPFFDDLDDRLRKIDPEIPLPTETAVEVVHRVMLGSLSMERPQLGGRRPKFRDRDLVRPVERVLIHARGCTAVKLIRVAQRNSIEVVLVQSDPDMDSASVDMLTERDRVVCIGGNTPDESYLNAMSVLRVAEHERVDSLHPGIGFLSENSSFAELCRSHGINFIGPPVASMEAMGNKSNAINTALRLDVPVVPGSHGILTNVERAAEVANQIGYPVLIKAVHGGGGKGIQTVDTPDDFHETFHRVTVEARAAFGNGDVYLEKYVTSLRHIEAQLLRDVHGNSRVLGLRDCSVQRDKQKILEESDSTMLPEDLRDAVLRHTAAIADEVGYVGAGTVEFIFDLKSNAVYFMEMNTRLQVEHPVTELVSGVDIVGEQFRIASGDSIAKLDIGRRGYAIEARINAERIVVGAGGKLLFRPDPGQVQQCELPQEDGIEIIATVGPGKFVSPYYDSMVAQVIAHGANRLDTIDKLLKYLGRVRISGICTNISLLKMILADAVFRDGVYDTNFLPDFLARIDANALIRQINDAAGKSSAGIDRNAIRIDGSDELKVLSPSTGIFYITPTPTEPEFVAVGDRIRVTDTLCQLEAMKIFTPLALKDFNNGDEELYPSAQRYEVTRINNTSGQQVNVGDLLFVVKPVAG